MIYHNLSVFCAVSDDEMISSLRLQLEIIHYDYTRTPMHRIYSKTAYQKLRTRKELCQQTLSLSPNTTSWLPRDCCACPLHTRLPQIDLVPRRGRKGHSSSPFQ